MSIERSTASEATGSPTSRLWSRASRASATSSGVPGASSSGGSFAACENRPREVVERVLRAGLAQDYETVLGLMAPDGHLEWPYRPPGVPARLEARASLP
ncbi:hypothetical protein ACWEPL_25365 [Nonomuraea sp. NPDC004186]